MGRPRRQREGPASGLRHGWKDGWGGVGWCQGRDWCTGWQSRQPSRLAMGAPGPVRAERAARRGGSRRGPAAASASRCPSRLSLRHRPRQRRASASRDRCAPATPCHRARANNRLHLHVQRGRGRPAVLWPGRQQVNAGTGLQGVARWLGCRRGCSGQPTPRPRHHNTPAGLPASPRPARRPPPAFRPWSETPIRPRRPAGR